MKNLKRIFWLTAGFTTGAVLVAKYVINYKQIKKKEKEHQTILNSLIESDKRIKKLLEREDIKKLKIRLKKRPKSENSNKKIQWKAWTNSTVQIPFINKSIIPHDKDRRLFYLAHEINHIKNKHNEHFRERRACGHTVKSCLAKELQADIGAQKDLEKINVELNKSFWLENFRDVRKQCKKCLEIINKGKCSNNETEKIKKYLKSLGEKND